MQTRHSAEVYIWDANVRVTLILLQKEIHQHKKSRVKKKKKSYNDIKSQALRLYNTIVNNNSGLPVYDPKLRNGLDRQQKILDIAGKYTNNIKKRQGVPWYGSPKDPNQKVSPKVYMGLAPT